jgi:imidazoleglycerol-phosphate dehydratase
MSDRKAVVTRNTKETSIKVELNIDGSGQTEITTGILFLDHMLDQLSRHGIFDMTISASGSDNHHVVEDVAICLGKAFQQALGDKKGINRMAHSIVPMDEALAMVALDISGRGYSVIDVEFAQLNIGELPSDLIRHFMESFATEAKINIHIKVFYGINDHHKAEAIFKAFAKAMDTATRLDPRISDSLPSTKDYIEK